MTSACCHYAKRVMDGAPPEDRGFQFNRLITAPNLKWANTRERLRAVLKRNGDTTSVSPPACSARMIAQVRHITPLVTPPCTGCMHGARARARPHFIPCDTL